MFLPVWLWLEKGYQDSNKCTPRWSQDDVHLQKSSHQTAGNALVEENPMDSSGAYPRGLSRLLALALALAQGAGWAKQGATQRVWVFKDWQFESWRSCQPWTS